MKRRLLWNTYDSFVTDLEADLSLAGIMAY